MVAMQSNHYKNTIVKFNKINERMELSILFFWLKIVEYKDIVVVDNSYWYNKHTEVDKLEFVYIFIIQY